MFQFNGVFSTTLLRELLRDRDLGEAHILLKRAGEAYSTYSLSGRLYRSKTGWGLLSVPNSFVRGAFDALREIGAELPLKDGKLNAHISVFRDDELEQIGGSDKVTEWGHAFSFNLGPVKTCVPEGWKDVAQVWLIECSSPELAKLRRSYGLSDTPKYPFHITIGIRRRGTLAHNSEVSKAAAMEKQAAGWGAIAQALGAIGTGAAVTEAERRAGAVSPEMSPYGYGALSALNSALAYSVLNPRLRRWTFSKTTNPGSVAIPKHPALPSGATINLPSTTTWRPARALAFGASAVAAPTTVQFADAGRAVGKDVLDNVGDPNSKLHQIIIDPAKAVEGVVRPKIDEAKGFVNEKVKEIGVPLATHLGFGLGGSIGGGVIGLLGSNALGRAVAPDDAQKSYETRNQRRRIRNLISFLGSTLGSYGGMYLANRMAGNFTVGDDSKNRTTSGVRAEIVQ